MSKKHEWVSVPSRLRHRKATHAWRECVHCGASIEFDHTIGYWLWAPPTLPTLEGIIDGVIHPEYHSKNGIKHPRISHPVFNRMTLGTRIPSCEHFRMESALE